MAQTTTKIDKQHVVKRVKDWEKRVSELYTTISSWLAGSEYSLRFGPKILMYEELMQQFNVPATNLPTADIYDSTTCILTLKPKGLWIIGANGRIDILSHKTNYLLIDYAEQFRKPDWRIVNSKKNTEINLNRRNFLSLLK